MASTTITLDAVKSGYIKENEPQDVFPTDDTTGYKITRDYEHAVWYRNCLCFGFEALPNLLKYSRIYEIAITLQMNGESGVVSSYGMADFDEDELTYANRRQVVGSGGEPYWGGRPSGWADVTSILLSSATAHVRSKSAVDYLKNKAFLVFNNTSDQNTTILAKTVLSNGDAPYITVTYDDAVTVANKVVVTNKIGYDSAGSFNATAPQTVTWDIIRDDLDLYYCVADSWEQQSAVFYWREQGESTWNQIPVNSSEKSVTIPANTFTSGGVTYEYYIQVTDVLNQTNTTGTMTCVSLTNVLHVLYGEEGDSPWWYYYNPHTPLTFYWEVYSAAAEGKQEGQPGNITITWRVYGGEEEEIQVPDFGATQYTVPAETFPAVELIQYKISGSDSTGYPLAVADIWYRFSTQAKPVNTTAIAPLNTVEKNNQPITFEWEYSSDDGSQPGKYKLMWREYGTIEWTTLIESTEIVTSYTVAARTFPIGQIEWAVVAYNVDGVPGSYSENTFIAYGAPEAPLVSATAVPYTTISWQSDGQQAFEIVINDEVYGPYFGSDKSFQLPDKLEDGEYTIKVRVAGTYYLWSDYGQTSITVQNSTDESVFLTATDGVDVVLEWETDGTTADFFIYRDGKIVAHTEQYTFSDKLANGTHTYKVVNRLPDGNYSESEERTASTASDKTYIVNVLGGEWIELQYQTDARNDVSFSESNGSSFYHLAGETFPSASVNEFKDSFVSIETAIQDKDKIERFETLLGQTVILKHKNYPVVVGLLDSWEKQINMWNWITYTFAIRKVEWEDYVDDTA